MRTGTVSVCKLYCCHACAVFLAPRACTDPPEGCGNMTGGGAAACWAWYACQAAACC